MNVRRSLVRGLLAGALLLAPALGPDAAAAGFATSSAGSSASIASSASASGSRAVASASASSGSASDAWAVASASASLSVWRGGIDLYRPGVFSTQKTWYWCTAATVQISRNIVFHRTDHSASAQQAYFDWMRRHDRYRLPLSAGVDAAGWTAGFQHFVDGRYRLSAAATFDAALRSAVTSLRRTGLPVALAVQHGNHAWLLTGFTATADPARTTRFTVTSVRVVGPLYGLQSTGGYDMPPDTRLTPTQLRHYFTPWYYAPIRMVWDGKFVSIQPSGTSATASASPKPSPSPTAKPTPASTPKPKPTPTPTPTPSPTLAPSPAATSVSAASPAATSASSPSSTSVAAVVTGAGVGASPAAPSTGPNPAGLPGGEAAATIDLMAVAPLVAVGALVVIVGALMFGRRRSRPS